MCTPCHLDSYFSWDRPIIWENKLNSDVKLCQVIICSREIRSKQQDAVFAVFLLNFFAKKKVKCREFFRISKVESTRRQERQPSEGCQFIILKNYSLDQYGNYSKLDFPSRHELHPKLLTTKNLVFEYCVTITRHHF